ncbi:hypothetical protein BBP40_003630 [Aspergillus hancockii]|nr:hypothetical protein BBP40_003630 [Aspergillus hancockii]
MPEVVASSSHIIPRLFEDHYPTYKDSSFFNDNDSLSNEPYLSDNPGVDKVEERAAKATALCLVVIYQGSYLGPKSNDASDNTSRDLPILSASPNANSTPGL